MNGTADFAHWSAGARAGGSAPGEAFRVASSLHRTCKLDLKPMAAEERAKKHTMHSPSFIRTLQPEFLGDSANHPGKCADVTSAQYGILARKDKNCSQSQKQDQKKSI